MGSLTVRNLSEDVKKRLRQRAAANGRSMEEEVRLLLAESAADVPAARAQSAAKAEATSAKPARTAAAHQILLIIAGGIAAYKSLDLIRRLRERGIAVRVVMTKAAQEFITPMSVGAIAGEHPFTELFDPSEFDVGHIRLARDNDLIVVAPATADIMARMANGHADDLASAVLLATDSQVLLAPAMNPRMWTNKATQRNVKQLLADGILTVGPNSGEMAESGEAGFGRMAEPLEIVAAIGKLLDNRETEAAHDKPLAGKHIVITAGPTHEPIDPVRYIANRSSGKQGHAIAAAAAAAGADVTLVSGPVNVPDPSGVKVIKVETARDMLNSVEHALPVDIAIFAAAVADWRVANAGEQKLKKQAGKTTPELSFVENPDILATIARRKTQRPKLVVGFAAETENVLANAKAKLAKKGCDWILANDVSAESGVMGGDRNSITLVRTSGVEAWPTQGKDDVAAMLIARIADAITK